MVRLASRARPAVESPSPSTSISTSPVFRVSTDSGPRVDGSLVKSRRCAEAVIGRRRGQLCRWVQFATLLRYPSFKAAVLGGW